MPSEKAIETLARALRTDLYGPITDESWQQVKSKWVDDLPWLMAQQKRERDRNREETTFWIHRPEKYDRD